jgi:putative flippase GtrA
MPPRYVPDRPTVSGARADAPRRDRLAPATRRLYRRAMARLEAFPAVAGLVRFGTVGASGVLVNLLILAGALKFARWPTGAGWHAGAETIATQVAILWNFGLTEVWVFAARETRARRWLRFAGYWLVSMLALAVQLPLTAAVVRVLPLGYVVCTGLTLVLLVVARYLACKVFLYSNTAWTRGKTLPSFGADREAKALR